MAYLGIKLGRHSVQAALWSENAGRPVEAHLPGLEVESSSWHPTLGRDGAGRLSWGEDLWAHLHEVAPAEVSLPEGLTGESSAALQALLREVLWPEVARLAEKELRGGERHRIGVAVTVPPSGELVAALQGSLPAGLELARVESVGACLLAAARAEMGKSLAGRVMTAHLGGAEAQLAVWEVEGGADRLSLRCLDERRVPDAGLEAILARVAGLTTGEWRLVALEELASEAERGLRQRLLRHLRRRLGESRATWEVAWQYDPPVDLRHLARWTHAGPAPLPAAGAREVLGAAAARLREELTGLAETGEAAIVLVSGAGAAPEYFGPELLRWFGRGRLPLLSQSGSLPARGAAALARWASSDRAVQVEVHRGDFPAAAVKSVAAPVKASPARVETLGAGRGSGLGLALSADGLSAAWAAAESPIAEVIPLQGRMMVPACVAIDRNAPGDRSWGALAEALGGAPERYALIRTLPAHVGTGTQFVVQGPDGRVSIEPEELLRWLLGEAAQDAITRSGRPGQPGGAVVACWPPEWEAKSRAEAQAMLERHLGLPTREADPAVAAWLSALPDPDTNAAVVLLVSGPGLYGAQLQRDQGAWGGWQVVARHVETGFGAEFAAEVLSRFLTDELNGRFARSYRYTDLLKARPGTETRLLGEGLRREGEELAERLVREPAATQRVELRLPGGGTALFDASVTREQWEGWAGKRIGEAVGRVLEGITVPRQADDALNGRAVLREMGSAVGRGTVLLAGGGASIPVFRRALEARDVEVTLHPQPEVAAVLGAALLAGKWAEQEPERPRADLCVVGPASRLVEEAARARGWSVGSWPGPSPRVAIVVVGAGPDGLARQEVEEMLHNGIPVLPVRLEPATGTGPVSLESLSPAGQGAIAAVLDQAQRLLDLQGK